MTAAQTKIAGAFAGLLLGGVAVALLSWLAGDRAPKPAPPAHPVAEFAGAIDAVWMQFSADTEAIVGDAQADFLRALAPEAKVVVTVGGPAEAAAFGQFAAARGLTRSVQIVPVPGPVSPWTRDRALFVRNAADGLRLLVPPDPDPEWARRFNDQRAVPLLAAALGNAKTAELPLAFDGGDLMLTGEAVFFGSNLWWQNRGRGYARPQDLAASLAKWTGKPAYALGDQDGDVPRYHLAMYAAVLDGKRALVGDPKLARAIAGPNFAPGDAAVETGDALLADDSTETQAQFDRAAADLQRLGWQVSRLPVVAFDERTYMTWTNAVAETRAGNRTVYLPVYARQTDDAASPLGRLDRAGAAAWQALGYAIKPIRVAGVWPHHGTIGCLVGVLARR